MLDGKQVRIAVPSHLLVFRNHRPITIDTWIKTGLFEMSTIPEGSSGRPYTEDEATDDFLSNKALDFIQEIWNEVDLDSLWRDSKVAEQVSS